MIEKFTTTKGAIITPDKYDLEVMQVETGENTAFLLPCTVDALREYFVAKQDEELGRWRWPGNSDYFVVPRDKKVRGRRVVRVFQESRGRVNDFFEDDIRIGETHATARAARDYFSVHPEPKPWHDAKPGEVWLITYRSPHQQRTANHAMTCVDDGGNLSFFNEYRLHTVRYTGIESACRIWPEGETND